MHKDRFFNKLSAYKDGELNREVKDDISLHLRSCNECRNRLAEFEKLDSLVKAAPKIKAADSFSFQVMAAINSLEEEAGRKSVLKIVLARVLEIMDDIFELISGHEHQRNTLEEFSDFPPLSVSHAYFNLMGQQR